MKTHYESAGEFCAKEVIDSYDSFECSKGHKWVEALQNRFDVLLPINFPVPHGENICPYCLSAMLSKLGRVTRKSIKGVK